jgi:hypothetical protein
MEFPEQDYYIIAKVLQKSNKITIPKRFGVEGDTVFIIIKRKD